MLTLEQVRAVNDGFKSGDLNAALQPLEETIDLRSNELPRLDKAALVALKEGLGNDDHVSVWAEAVLHPNISVRRFARKVFMGMGDEAAPLFEPLRQRIERYWSEVAPLPETNKPREAALRREQKEMVEGALELLLRSNPEKFLEFYAEIVDATPVGNKPNTKAIREWQERSQVAAQAFHQEVDRLLTEEFGSEWTEPSLRCKLPPRVMQEVNERAQQNPEVMKLWEQLGDSPYVRAAVRWRPERLMLAALRPYLNEKESTGLVQRLADRLRCITWNWGRGAFDFESTTDERVRNVRRLMGNYGRHTFQHWLGTRNLQVEAPRLLVKAKPHLQTPLETVLKSERGFYDPDVEGDGVVAQFWLLLVLDLGNVLDRDFNRSRQLPGQEWTLPTEVEIEDLRQLAGDLKAQKNSEHMFDSLNATIKNLEAVREAQKAAEHGKGEETKVVTSSRSLVSSAAMAERGGMSLLTIRARLVNPVALILQPYEVLGDEQIRQIYQELGCEEEAQAKFNAELEKVEREIESIVEPEKRVEILVQPLAHDTRKTIPRLPYWRIWSKVLGENGHQKLKETIWDEVSPKLWHLLETKLQEYRRAETDPIEAKIEQKLTPSEVKDWHAHMRVDALRLIESDISDITDLLFFVEGVQARLKAIKLADRPSCRGLRDQMEVALIEELERSPGDYQSQFAPLPGWDKWQLGEEWEIVLRKGEARLEKTKDERERSRLQRQLATGYYRRGQFDKFKDMGTRPGAFPESVARAVVALDDFEAWRALLGATEREAGWQLTNYWQAQLGDPQRKVRAMDAALSTLVSTSSEEGALRLLDWLSTMPPTELEGYSADIEKALESALVPVKKWAMGVLAKLPAAKFDCERAATAAGEALWSDNVGLAKDAAKFLGQLGERSSEAAEVAWEALYDATALENVGVLEAVFRALTQLKSKNKELQLPDLAREKLEALVGVRADRFAKFEKKLA